LLPVGEVPQ